MHSLARGVLENASLRISQEHCSFVLPRDFLMWFVFSYCGGGPQDGNSRGRNENKPGEKVPRSTCTRQASEELRAGLRQADCRASRIFTTWSLGLAMLLASGPHLEHRHFRHEEGISESVTFRVRRILRRESMRGLVAIFSRPFGFCRGAWGEKQETRGGPPFLYKRSSEQLIFISYRSEFYTWFYWIRGLCDLKQKRNCQSGLAFFFFQCTNEETEAETSDHRCAWLGLSGV